MRGRVASHVTSPARRAAPTAPGTRRESHGRASGRASCIATPRPRWSRLGHDNLSHPRTDPGREAKRGGGVRRQRGCCRAGSRASGCLGEAGDRSPATQADRPGVLAPGRVCGAPLWTLRASNPSLDCPRGLALTLPAPITRLGAFLGVLTALASKPVALRCSISQVFPSLEGEGTRACVGPPQPPMSLQGGLGRGAPPPSGGGPSDAL